MTSSLVGSEMCIRDRAYTAPDRLNSTQHTNAAARPFREGRALWPRRNAVSYTHLTLPTICSV
eukprot:8897947-Prorocentrum_lima.AAC.1